MLYKNILIMIIVLFLTNCTTMNIVDNKQNSIIVNSYLNKGFALVYTDDLYDQKVVSKKINERSLTIFQKNLKINTKVKITNILNNKTIIATVGKNSEYPAFNNSVLSTRIADVLHLDLNEPYIEILEIHKNSMFIAKKAKTYEEEKTVVKKAPVNNISINNLNTVEKKIEKKLSRKFSYNIKIADFYFKDTALSMLNRIKNESLIKNSKIKKITDKKYRVYLGPFDNINSLQKSYNSISILEFENIELIRND